ncbi:hypothetical protein [Luethyella okanaganae]|uniref:O-antigen/teichoic acid export membrane protein n=1 Tax=Luethyella okanaganae TaxID=69372 RepID=A0ABW1VAA5_9MICO
MRRHALSIVDQALSSGTSFIAVLAMARSLEPTVFGVFAMLFTALTLFLGLSRAFFGIPVALATAGSADHLRRLFSASTTALSLLFIPLALMVAVTGLLATDQRDSTTMVLIAMIALATPLVMIQDLCRYYAIAKGEPFKAVLSDAVRLGGALVLFVTGPFLESTTLSIAWAMIVFLSVITVMPSLRPRLLFREGLRLLSPRRGLRESVTLAVALSTGVTLAMGFLMVPFLGASAVGTIRGAGTLFGPVNTLIALLDFSVLGSLSTRERSRDVRSVVAVTGVLTLVTAAWAGILLLLPETVGRLLLGETWSSTRAILPITSVEYLFLAVSAGLTLIFKLRDRPRVLLLNRVLSSVVILVAVIVALITGGGVASMAWALLLGAFMSASGMARGTEREHRVLPRELTR